MSFSLTNSIKIEDKEVFITISDQFGDYFESLLELNQFQNVENIKDFNHDHIDIKDMVLVTIESEIAKTETAFATFKKDVSKIIDTFIKKLEKREDYELCELFLKTKNEYNNYLNEK